MIRMSQAKCVCGLLFALMASATASQAGAVLGTPYGEVPRMVLTFYYPWYGVPDGPGGAGRTVHWGRIDEAKKDIEASTHYPALGAYDSHDPNVLDQHCQWAKYAGIDAFIASWWGHNSFSDRAMPRILDSCKRHGLHACIYYETVPKPQTPQTAAEDIIKVLNKYGQHSAHLRINGKPVVFVYGRALQQLGLTAWLEAIKIINRDYKGGVTAIGDQFSYGAARVFDGLHTYNTAGSLRGMAPGAVRQWAGDKYPAWVQIADKAGKISAITVIPGYDDTKIRKPGLAVERYDGELYRVQWEQAIKANPHWVLITSFNEWHEGSEIEPSTEYGQKYLELTSQYARTFKAKKRSPANRVTSEQFSPQEKVRLREKLEALRIGVLPNAESMAFWWLLDSGVTPEMLAWEDVASGISAKQYAALLYCGPERCRRSVHESGDVDAGLVNYLKEGGCTAFLPSGPWPFYYDQNGRTANRSSQFGLTLRSGWEKPPGDTELHLVQPQHYLKHLPKEFAFPTSGDLRWRPFFADNHTEHTSILQLRDSDGAYLGDAVAYAELGSGGKIVYAWFSLLEGPHAEALLYDLFDFIATKLNQRGS
jgi:glycoprotein endo-alpha-1,2-mannosidase